MIKATDPYQFFGYKILELVVDSKSITSSDRYDPYLISIFKSSNPILTEKIIQSQAREHLVRKIEEKIHFRARDQPPACVPIQNENEKEEEWLMDVEDDHMDVMDDDIYDVADLNMGEIYDEMDVEEIVR
jgi:hypothetical protein